MVREPHFFQQFFVDHHLKRFLGNAHHAAPVWFYGPVLVVGCLPWSGLLLPWLRFQCSRSPEVATLRTPALGFCLLWATWIAIFFSLSHGKLPTYLLPAFPPLALLIGHFLDVVLFLRVADRSFRRTVRYVPAWTITGLAIGWLGANLWAWSRGLHAATRGFGLVEAILCVGCLAVVIFWRKRLTVLKTWGLCAALGAAFLATGVNKYIPAWSRQRSPLAEAPMFARMMQDRSTGVTCVGSEWGCIPFQLDDDERFCNGLVHSPDEVKAFLLKYQQALMVTPATNDPRETALFIPAEMAIRESVASGKAQVHVLERKRDRRSIPAPGNPIK